MLGAPGNDGIRGLFNASVHTARSRKRLVVVDRERNARVLHLFPRLRTPPHSDLGIRIPLICR